MHAPRTGTVCCLASTGRRWPLPACLHACMYPCAVFAPPPVVPAYSYSM
jgi:hypothetical protein